MQEIPDDRSISRRTVLTSAVGAAAFVPLSALTATAQTVKPVLSTTQRLLLEAFVDRMVPRDEYGPSASDCGVPDYIDRSLGDYLASEKSSLLEGLAATDALARSIHNTAFVELTPEKKDEVLTAMERGGVTSFPDSRTFFFRVRQLTLEGMFGDPFYGGNHAYAGWDLIRYPGPRLAVGPEQQQIKVAIKPVRASAYGGAHGH
jgi:hypothetical protein